ncbi:PTS sugar transporter subunit IIC [Lactobacillus amylovorus]|uniref:PTS sugar transporter subunit IIC n=1 Tax=Lactobacillus amylovorus TaxID=1604 RepID=UPI003099CAF6
MVTNNISQSKFVVGMSKQAAKMNKNVALKALTQGFMGTTIISLGVSLFSIIVNLPIKPWQTFLNATKIFSTVNAALSVTISMLGIYVVMSVAYHFTKLKKENPITGVLIATSVYFILMPLSINKTATSININYMGSNGIFTAVIVGLVAPALYVWLTHKNLRVKLPATVPPMVSESLEPLWSAMFIFSLAMIIKYIFLFLPGGNFFDFIGDVISAPLNHLALTPLTYILFGVLCNFLWWLGIHPAVLMGASMPLLTAATTANVSAFLSGKALPYLIFSALGGLINLGGAGNTIALVSLFPFAKSDRYKSLGKLAFIPNLFNINEPVVFGAPVILNPFYVIPMVLTTLASGLITWGIMALGFVPALNPTVQPPYVLPNVISNFLSGGWKFAALAVIAYLIDILIYYPFFKVADNIAYKEEQENLKKEEKKAESK